MKTCADVDAVMTPFVDGVLASDTAAAVARHLTDCSPCRDRVACERTARRSVRSQAARIRASAPSTLHARCVAATLSPGAGPRGVSWRARLTGWVPVSLAATLMFAVGGIFAAGQHERIEAAFVAQLALDHDRCFGHVDRSSGDLSTRDVERQLSAFYGWNLTMPAESDDFNLVDARKCLYDNGDMAHVLCEWRGEPVSIFVVPERASRERNLEIMRHDAVTWSKDDRAFALVAWRGPVAMDEVVRYVRQYTD